jgi:DNA polymerase-3 subunit delta'
LQLADENGTALATLAEDALRGAPGLPSARVLAIAEQATRTDGGFATFMALLGEGVADAAREAAMRGEAGGAHGRPLVEWVEVWQAILRLREETERFNLDKRHAVAASLALLNGP